MSPSSRSLSSNRLPRLTLAGPPAAGARDALRRVSRNAGLSMGVRQAAAMALGSIDPGGAKVKEAVLEALDDGDGSIVIGATIAIARMEPAPEWAVLPLLGAMAKSENPAVHKYVIQAIGKIGDPSPAVLDMLDWISEKYEEPPDKPWDVRREAREAAKRIRKGLDGSR